MIFLNEQTIIELGSPFTEWRRDLILTHHLFGNAPHFWIVEKHIFEKTRCPLICKFVVFHTIMGDIRTITLSLKYNDSPTFFDLILIPIFEKYCAENNSELKVLKRDIYG
jgi:hypothetical protein